MINQSRDAWQGSSAATVLMMTKLMSVCKYIYGSEPSGLPFLCCAGQSQLGKCLKTEVKNTQVFQMMMHCCEWNSPFVVHGMHGF